MIYKPSPRRRSLDIRGVTAFQWWPDAAGKARVHPDNGVAIMEERGIWLPLSGDTVTFPKQDRRRTARA